MPPVQVARLVRPAGYICPRCARNQLSKPFSTIRTLHTPSNPPGRSQSVLQLLEERGYIARVAGDRDVLDARLRTQPVGFYAGVDPTAPSLHLGHLLPMMVLFWLYLHGHHVVSLVGGGTATVGDPSGRLTSRARTAEEVQRSNLEAMLSQTGRLWKNVVSYGMRHGFRSEEMGKTQLLDNADWLRGLNVLDFLKTLGNGMRLGTMLGRDTVKNKMEKGDGMSFSEFTYPLLQGWDWWHMYKNMNVQVQIGGSDQYGNIVAGLDAVKYIAQNNGQSPASDQPWLDRHGKLQEAAAPMGLTVPLLTTSSGEKFGKSAGNAIWLDRNLTSPFDLYGFLLRSSDADVPRYLKLFTFAPLEAIKSVMVEHGRDPGKRKAQHLLASEVLELVHGREEAEKIRSEHQAMRNPTLAASESAEERVFLPRSLVENTPFARVLYHAGLAGTKSEGARLIAKGGVYAALADKETDARGNETLRFVQIKDQKPEVSVKDGLLILRMGKWKVRVLEVIDDQTFVSRGLSAPGWAEWKGKHTL